MYKGKMVVGERDGDDSVDSHAEVYMLDVKRCTASSISEVVFSRIFKLFFCNIDFWKFFHLYVNLMVYRIDWTKARSLIWVEQENHLNTGRED